MKHKGTITMRMRANYPYRSLACAVLQRAYRDAHGGTINGKRCGEVSPHAVRVWAQRTDGIQPEVVLD